MSGWIKLHRKLLTWEWYDDTNVVRLFFHLLLTVNYEPRRWHGIEIQPGQIVTSINKLSSQTGLSQQQTRTAIDKLKSTQEITNHPHSNFSIITIAKWSDYQEDNTQDNKPPTNEQQASNKRITTTKEGKKERRKEGKKNIYVREFAEFWDVYPRKAGSKQKAMEALTKSLEQGVEYGTIISGAGAYREQCEAHGTEQRFIKHAATWLNQQCWDDDYPIETKRAGKGALAREHADRGLREFLDSSPF